MDLSTTYLGFRLPHPLVPGAGPLSDTLDGVRRLEDTGAPMIVLRSLFEEAIAVNSGTPGTGTLGPAEYLEHLHRVKKSVHIPVVASLNGTTLGGWLHHARLLQQAGADALELNVYELATDPARTGRSIESETLQMVMQVKNILRIPLAVKISPFYTSLPHLAHQLDELAADGLVLFNRFYQPDIDVESLRVVPTLRLSTPSELLLRVRWTAILYGRVRMSLAITGGVHATNDIVRAILSGAATVQIVSALLRNGPAYLGELRDSLAQWMELHEFESVAQLLGRLSLRNCPDPKALERANYMQVLETWNPHSAERSTIEKADDSP